MRFTSRLLQDAINFVCTDPKAYAAIKKRNRSKRLTIGEIRAKIVKVNAKKSTALIKIGFDYHQIGQTTNAAEDLIITLVWKKYKGFKIHKVLKYPQI